MVDSWLTVLQSYTESLRTACLLGLLHDVDAPKRLVVIWMQTHAHTWTHIYYVDTYIQVGKKKLILTQKIDGLTSPSCCHYQIFNNGLKVYRSSRWQLNQTHVLRSFGFAQQKCVRCLLYKNDQTNENKFLSSITGILNKIIHCSSGRSYRLLDILDVTFIFLLFTLF